MKEQKSPTYGSSLHYSGNSGVEYLAWQDSLGVINGVINARKFKSFDLSQCVVLDFGSGTGNLLNSIDARVKIAVEINEYAHPLLIKRGISAHTSIEEIPSDSIDVVISNHALEHVPYPIEAMREIRRTIKPGGTFLLVVPIDDWRTQRTFQKNDINNHLNTWTPLLLGNALQEAGFSVNQRDISILSQAWFPGYKKFYRAPGFNMLCKGYAIIRKRRQLFAKLTNIKTLA
jgi:SAM-dependent methyltransferase